MVVVRGGPRRRQTDHAFEHAARRGSGPSSGQQLAAAVEADGVVDERIGSTSGRGDDRLHNGIGPVILPEAGAANDASTLRNKIEGANDLTDRLEATELDLGSDVSLDDVRQLIADVGDRCASYQDAQDRIEALVTDSGDDGMMG